MSTPQPPSVDQLAAARLVHWHQNAEPGAETPTVAVLTLESARQFVSSCGLLLFTPRPQHIQSPAPSFVEATLGHANPAPSFAEVGEARTLLARLVADGSVVPLNLLGAPTVTPDTPDFVASAATFAYVFTLRGEKAFKQLPSTSGATKVSPLALNTYNLLIENGPATAPDLASVLGKEVTEAAVLRALNELWQHLRVLPVPSPDGGSTFWETITNRFTKQLKAGANAGQPSALSALISLYLSQALLASATEIETFLSPLAPRSRVRDVLHALTGARQIETIAVEGTTLLHIHGELPSFSANVGAEAVDEDAKDTPQIELAEDGSRIKRFVPKPRKVGTGYVERAKPFRSDARSDRGERSPDRPSRARPGSGNSKAGTPSRTLNRPWDEEKQQRKGRNAGVEPNKAETQGLGHDASAAAPESRPTFGARPPKRDFGAKPRLTGDGASFSRPKFGGDRPAFSRGREQRPDDRPPRLARPEGAEDPGTSFGKRKPYAKRAAGAKEDPSFGSRPTFEDKERRPFRRDGAGGGSRPPRREFPTSRSDSGSPKRVGFSKPRPFQDRAEGEISSGERPAFRKFDAPRGPRKPFGPREDGPSRPPRRDFTDSRGSGPTGRAPFSKASDNPRGGAGPRTGPNDGFKPRERSGFAGKGRDGSFTGKRPEGGFAGRKSAGSGVAGKMPFAGKAARRSGTDAPGASTFDKFKGGNKPWGKRPPGRKPKPEEGEA